MLRLIVRLRNLVEKISYEVLELCCFEWFQNVCIEKDNLASFRAVLFRMVPKRWSSRYWCSTGFRAVLFRMVPKRSILFLSNSISFRAVLFRMVPKRRFLQFAMVWSFRAVLLRMVPKLKQEVLNL